MKTSVVIVGLACLLLVQADYRKVSAADKFKQEVSPQFESSVLEARKLRLPYLVNDYDPQKSIEILKDVISQKPDYYRAYFNLGLAYHELGEYKNSIVAFDEALRIRDLQSIPDNTLVNTAGWVSLKNGDYKRAEELLKKAEALTKGENSFTEGAVHSNLGELYFLTQRFEESKKYFEISQDKFGNDSARYFFKYIDEIRSKIKK